VRLVIWRKSYFLLLPLGALLLLLAAVQALPDYVSSAGHRAQIESFASSLTGRHVRIAGNVSLGLVPLTVSATGITISGPDQEIITAKSLAMDLSVAALLRGQLAADSLTLDEPRISLPWPLPGGPNAVAPPPLLAALHAVVTNGTLSLDGLTVTGVSADILTSAGGGFSVSGTGSAAGLPLSLSLNLAPAGLTGDAPLTVDAGTAGTQMHLSGILTASGGINGQAQLTLPEGITGSGQITAGASSIAVQSLNLTQGNAALTGTANLALAPLALSANLTGQNLNLDALSPAAWATPVPVTLSLDASAITSGGQVYPALSLQLTAGPDGTTLNSATLTLPGGGTLTGSGHIAGNGTISGNASLAVPDTAAFLPGYGLPALPIWPSAHLSARLAGTAQSLTLQDLSGTLGADHVAGTLVLAGSHASGALAFDHLALAPLSTWLSQRPMDGFTADAEITAATASAGPVQMSHFALDGALDGTLNIRRVSAQLYGGLAAGSFTLDSSGQVTSAHGFLDIPSAAPLAALLPAAWTPPKAVLAPRLTLSLAARGPATALATSAVLTLGQFTVTAAPVLDLTHMTAAGPLSLRHPNAITVLQLFGLPAGLPFPGAGSASLRASFTASPTGFGLPDFALSFGNLTATGGVTAQNGKLSGDIAADTLALPRVSGTLQLPALPALTGTVTLTANRVLYAGAPLLGATAASLSLSPGGAALTLSHAALAGGQISGQMSAALAMGVPPKFSAQLQVQNLDVTALPLPVAFPYPLTAGQVSGTASLTASGFTPSIWLATLAGTAQMSVSNGALHGFSLSSVVQALGQPSPLAKLRLALTSGGTAFSSLSLNGTFAQGNCALTSGQLNTPAGTVSLQPGSSVDLYDQTLGLRLAISPAVTPPLTITQFTVGSWAKPKHIAHLTAAASWAPAK
jgi:uncharacterized protein involved in outer membrane biogenesis